MAFDLLIRNGTLIDGTGAPARRADVAIAGGRIVEIGDVTGSAARVIDAAAVGYTPRQAVCKALRVEVGLLPR